MKLDNTVSKARSTSTRAAAAKLYNNIEMELALGDVPGDLETEGEDALRELESKYPGIKADAHSIETPPALSRSASSGLNAPHGSRRRRSTGSRPSPSPTRPKPKPRPSGSSGARRAVSGAVSSADSATGGYGQLIAQVFAWGLGLSIAYLLLSRAEGAVRLAQGAANVTRAIVGVGIDPLNPNMTAAQIHAASARAAGTAPAGTAPATGAGVQRAGNQIATAIQHVGSTVTHR